MSGTGIRRERFHRSYVDSYLLGPTPSAVTSAALQATAGAARAVDPSAAPAQQKAAVPPVQTASPHPLDTLFTQRSEALAHGERQETESGPKAIADAFGLFRHLTEDDPPARSRADESGAALASHTSNKPTTVEALPEVNDDVWDLLLEIDGGRSPATTRERAQLQLVPNPPVAADLDNHSCLYDDDGNLDVSGADWELNVEIDDDTMDPQAISGHLSEDGEGDDTDGGQPSVAPQDFAAAVRWALSATMDDKMLDAWLSEEAQ
jgi:hypothetical protein